MGVLDRIAKMACTIADSASSVGGAENDYRGLVYAQRIQRNAALKYLHIPNVKDSISIIVGQLRWRGGLHAIA